MLKRLKNNIKDDHEIKGCIFRVSSVLNCLVALKGNIFGKIKEHYLCATILLFCPKAFQKNSFSGLWDMRLQNFHPNWSQINCLSQRGCCFWKLINVTFEHLFCFTMLKSSKKPLQWIMSGLSIVPYLAIVLQKNLWGWSWDIRLRSFGQNKSQISHLSQKGIFSGKLTIFTFF